jgi:S1-C subfamily serine protease
MRFSAYVAMFLVCFLGVYLALWVHDRFQPKISPALPSAPAPTPVSTIVANQPVAFTEAAKKIMPAVVSVERVEAGGFFGSPERFRLTGMGSGVILTPDGHIITNYHVVEGADAIVVHLLNGRGFQAKVVGVDEMSDLALLKVEAKNLPYGELGDSDALLVGEWVAAIGNPLGYEGTLSVGVVSALNRDLPGRGDRFPLVGVIQTDAAINQGNSGGALVNLKGEVVGINSAIASTDVGNIGIGFAIPSNRVRRFVEDIRKYGRARHPDLGVLGFFHPAVRYSWWYRERVGAEPPQEGLVIAEIAPGSPLAEAGAEPGDILLALDKKPLETPSDYWTYLLKAEIGQKARVRLWRRGEIKEFTVILKERP